jgi:hypothetical protein
MNVWSYTSNPLYTFRASFLIAQWYRVITTFQRTVCSSTSTQLVVSPNDKAAEVWSAFESGWFRFGAKNIDFRDPAVILREDTYIIY